MCYCLKLGYSFWLAARILLYAPSNTQTGYYTSCGALGRMKKERKNIPVDPLRGINLALWMMNIKPATVITGLLFLISSNNSFICTIPQRVHYTSCEALGGMKKKENISQWNQWGINLPLWTMNIKPVTAITLAARVLLYASFQQTVHCTSCEAPSV